MQRRTIRGNRVGLIIVALLLALAGAAIITVHLGVFGKTAAQTKLYPQPAARWVTGHDWIFWIAAVLAVIVALIALRWLVVQLRTDRVHRLVMDTEQNTDPGSGRTSLAAGAITAVITGDAEAITGVRNANASLSGPRDAPELWLKVTVDDNADTGAIRTLLLDNVLADARTALEMPQMPTYLTLTVSSRSTSRQVA